MENIIKQINRDLEANFSAIRQMNNSVFSYHDEFARHLQEMTLDIPNISIGLNKKLLETINSASKQIEKTSKLFETYNALQNSNIFKASDLVSKSLESIILNQNSFLNTHDFSQLSNLAKAIESNFSNFSIDDATIVEIEAQDIIINEDNKKIINQTIECIYEASPEFKRLIESFKENNYYKVVVIVIFLILLKLAGVYVDYYLTQLLSSNDFYKINRNNVRIRETPDIKNDKNIMCKLNKNISVIKIDSENGWVKVRFEQGEGVEKEGWVYSNMLSKVE